MSIAGVWRDVTADDDVLADTPIVIRRGQDGETPALRPSTITLRLDNGDDRFRLTNPMSPLYGLVGRNTPIRVSVDGAIRGYGKIASIVTDQTNDFRPYPRRGKAWADVTASGSLQQVVQWTQPPRSALYRAMAYSGVTPAECWPMEDPSGSQEAASACGGSPMTPVTTARYTLPDGSVLTPGGAPRFADGAGIAGAAPLVSFQGGGTLSAPVRTATFNGYAIDWVMQFQAGSDDGGTSTGNVLAWAENGTYVYFYVNVVKNFVTVLHADPAARSTFTSSGSATAAFDVYDGAPHHFRYQVRQSGGNYLAQLYIDSALYATADNFATPGLMAGTVGQPTAVEWNPIEDNGDFMPIAAGHLIIWKSGQIGGQPPVFYALNGYATERTAYRFDRVCDEQDIIHYTSGGFLSSTPMGPQRPDTFPDLLTECMITEDALIYDLRDQDGFRFLCRADRYDQTPYVELTPDDLESLPREALDDRARNVVTADQRQGGDSTARDDTGPLGTQDPPNGVGEYLQKVPVNVDKPTDQLPQVANWWLRKGTVELPRYPQVTINLDKLPAYKRIQVENLDVGNVLLLSGFRENTLRLQVIGYTETLRNAEARKITFTTVPDQQYDVGKWDATDSRWDSKTSTIAAASRTAASWTITTTNAGDVWSTTTPYDLIASGERVTVTAMSAVSGTGPYVQTATVKRSMNGVAKDQTAGTPVHAWTPGEWAL